MLEPKFTYKKTYISIPITIAAGQSLSPLADMGGVVLRRIALPANWTACDLSFLVPEKPTDIARDLINYDGVSSSVLTVPSTALNTTIPFFAHWFDSIGYLQLSCSTVQITAATVILICEPLWQGVHG